MTARLVVLVSGEGSNLRALLDASTDPTYGARVVAVGADRKDIPALRHAEDAGVATFVVRLEDCADRSDFDAHVIEAVAAHQPDLVVLAGYMKILGPDVVTRWPMVNTHPALLPSFPGGHAVRDALAYGVTVTGATVHFVDAGVDTGPVIAQRAVPVEGDDDEARLHERIKAVECGLLVDTVGRLARNGFRLEGRKVVLL
jgi:phosphoribosylglycinamide formyltransferase-1